MTKDRPPSVITWSNIETRPEPPTQEQVAGAVRMLETIPDEDGVPQRRRKELGILTGEPR